MPQRLQLPWALMTEGAIQVNLQGERFGNEHEGYSESALFVLAQPEGIAFNIYDERIHEVGLAMPNYLEAVTKGADQARRRRCAIWPKHSASIATDSNRAWPW